MSLMANEKKEVGIFLKAQELPCGFMVTLNRLLFPVAFL